jgi:hypothetical protein
MLYLIVHQPPAPAAFGEALQQRYTAHAVQVSTWILEVPIPTADDLLAELKRIIPLDQNASLLVTEVCGKPAGWQALCRTPSWSTSIGGTTPLSRVSRWYWS